MDLRAMLERDEGRVKTAYPDPLTGAEPWTIGIGHCGAVKKGDVWSDTQIDAAFDADLEKATDGCRRELPWFDSLSEPRRAVLISMAFQMGVKGLMEFTHTLEMVGKGLYANAARGMLESRWAKQTPKRAQRLAAQMQTGKWT